jgi:hypothetical protein
LLGSLARQPCPAALPGSLAWQPCPAALPGSLARQPCPAALPGSLARQPCPAIYEYLFGFFFKYSLFEIIFLKNIHYSNFFFNEYLNFFRDIFCWNWC